MPNYDKTDLTNTLNYIKSEYGISCFKDDKIIALLSDLAPSLKRERFLLKKFVDSGLMKEIAENAYTDETRQRQIIFKTHSFLVDEEFLQSDIVEQYLCILSKVLNYHTDFTKDMQILNQDTTLNLNSQKTISHENDNSLMSQIKSKSISIDVDFKNVIFNFCNIIVEMVLCPAGSFMMGSPENELGRKYDEKYHQVTLTKDFLIGKFPVTQALYKEVLGSNPSKFTGENNPVENVSWGVAKLFCHILNKIYAPLLPRGYVFDLPTEAQWEYACRAGTTTALNNGKNLTTSSGNCLNLNEIAWHYENSGYKTHPVGQKKPNEWGIYDMLGNVWEWCRDSYGDYPTSNVTDPISTNSSNYVLRGGAWYDRASYSRSASRYHYSSDCRYNYLGFRLALVPNS